jgi:ABC-type bacteriocin/lantibiotic exporter with double-glycine peptidase domain
MEDFPFHKQETEWTCGSAVMRMALEQVGIKKSEKQVIKILGTNKVRGTWPREFPRVAEKYKLNYVVKRNASTDDLEYFQKRGYVVIICYYHPKESTDHYAILKSIDSENIYFYDPWFGHKHKYSLNYFNKFWRFDRKFSNGKRWFFAVKKPRIN